MKAELVLIIGEQNVSSGLTWKCSFIEFDDWFGAIPAFDCNFFASSVLFNLLLKCEKNTEVKNSFFTEMLKQILH